MTFIVLVIAIILWLRAFFAWFVLEPGYEPITVFLQADITALLSLFGILGRSVPSDTPIFPLTNEAVRSREKRFRDNLLDKVRTIWISGYLTDSLHDMTLIKSGYDNRPDAVDRPWPMTLGQSQDSNEVFPAGAKIIELFRELSGSMLLLGQPGSGKTTTLLELARDLLIEAKKNEHQPVPVVINLSSWAPKQKSVAEWLVDPNTLNALEWYLLDLALRGINS